MSATIQQAIDEPDADTAALQARLEMAETRKAEALVRKKELDNELKQLQQEEDDGALDTIRDQLKL